VGRNIELLVLAVVLAPCPRHTGAQILISPTSLYGTVSEKRKTNPGPFYSPYKEKMCIVLPFPLFMKEFSEDGEN
jgi:hypothetical protein